MTLTCRLESTAYPEEGTSGRCRQQVGKHFPGPQGAVGLGNPIRPAGGLALSGRIRRATGYAIQDAYAFFKPAAALQLQVGKFKVPVGLERLQSDTDTLFVERASADGLSP